MNASRPRMSWMRTRLALALTTSSVVLLATAGGAFWPSALLWSVPALVAMRCLPLPLALPLVLVSGTAGRVLAEGVLEMDWALAPALLASVALVPALFLDRFVSSWLPRASLLLWPCALVVTERLFGALATPLSPAVSLEAFQFAVQDGGVATRTFVTAFVAQGFAALGALHNRAHDPLPALERDADARWATIAAFVMMVLVMLIGTARSALGGAPALDTPAPGDGTVVLSAGALVVLVVLAWRELRNTAPLRALQRREQEI